MRPNLVICGAGLLLTAAMGLYGAPPPVGTAVDDASAFQIHGAGTKVDCTLYKQDTEAGCGQDAKPKTNGVGDTKCQKVVTWTKDDKGDKNVKPKTVETCYECCYSCGTRITTVTLCDKKGSGSGGLLP